MKNQQFITKAILKHNALYDYQMVNYITQYDKVIIICKKHGEFKQTPKNHLKGQGCPKCRNEQLSIKNTSNIELFILKAKRIHSNWYDYSKSRYINAYTRLIITCPIHGDFEQIPSNHLNGNGCIKCRTLNQTKTSDIFIIEASKIHGNLYTYDNIEYINARTKVNINCNVHGEFWQTPDKHLKGNGCPKCNSSKGELKIREWLKENNIQFEEQKYFSDCRNVLPLPFDFYLPEHNICIEFDGIQHYKPTCFGHYNKELAQLNLSNCKIRDNIKTEFCKTHNIKFVRIPYFKQQNINVILKEIIC